MVGNKALALQYPVGSSNEALRSAVVRLVDVLRTIQTDADQQASIDEITATLATVQTSITGVVTSVSDLETTTTAADVALNAGVTSVLAAVGLVEADVAALQSNQLTPQERFEIALDHAIDSVQGSRSEWVADVETQMRRMADALLQVSRHQQDDAAAITVEQTVRVTENEAFAQQVTAIEADIASTSAALVTEQTARANGDTALASSISSVSTTVGGNTAAITSLTSSVNGISANWTVAVNANDRVTGMVTLNGSENTSLFAVLADKFTIVHPAADGTTIQAFTTGLVNGVSTVGLNGTVIIDGTLLARHIAAGEITSAKIAAGAVTADKISATSLSAINADLGIITAGLIRNSADTVRFDLPNMRWYRVDGKAQIDLANQIFEFIA